MGLYIIIIFIKRYKGRQRVLKVESCSFEGSIFQMADTLEPYWSLWRLFSSSSRNPCSCVLEIFLVLICHCTKKAQSKQASSHHFQNIQVWLPGKKLAEACMRRRVSWFATALRRDLNQLLGADQQAPTHTDAESSPLVILRYSSDAVAHLVLTLILQLGWKRLPCEPGIWFQLSFVILCTTCCPYTAWICNIYDGCHAHLEIRTEALRLKHGMREVWHM